MKVKLRVNVSDVGLDGEVVEVEDEQKAKWLCDGGYAYQVGEDPVPQEDSV